MLAHDYGFKRVMSSYYFSNTDQARVLGPVTTFQTQARQESHVQLLLLRHRPGKSFRPRYFFSDADQARESYPVTTLRHRPGKSFRSSHYFSDTGQARESCPVTASQI